MEPDFKRFANGIFPKPTMTFPRTNWMLLKGGDPPISDLDSVGRAPKWCAQRAAEEWSQATTSGKWQQIDHDCFALNVFAKVAEFSAYHYLPLPGSPFFRGPPDASWVKVTNDYVEPVYVAACKAIEEHDPHHDFPSLSQVHKVARVALNWSLPGVGFRTARAEEAYYEKLDIEELASLLGRFNPYRYGWESLVVAFPWDDSPPFDQRWSQEKEKDGVLQPIIINPPEPDYEEDSGSETETGNATPPALGRRPRRRREWSDPTDLSNYYLLPPNMTARSSWQTRSRDQTLPSMQEVLALDLHQLTL